MSASPDGVRPPGGLTPTLGAVARTARERRAPLLAAMRALGEQGVACASCTGLCCTSVANSMQLTPVEAVDLHAALVADGRWTSELEERLRTTAAQYGLDRPPPGDGRRVFGRRTYTCPFFAGGGKGCTVSRSVKPYGCLGFNPRRAAVTEGEACGSARELLEERERAVQDEAAWNESLRDALALSWDKSPLPTALLAVGAALAATQ